MRLTGLSVWKTYFNFFFLIYPFMTFFALLGYPFSRLCDPFRQHTFSVQILKHVCGYCSQIFRQMNFVGYHIIYCRYMSDLAPAHHSRITDKKILPNKYTYIKYQRKQIHEKEKRKTKVMISKDDLLNRLYYEISHYGKLYRKVLKFLFCLHY